jgi:uncharacterized membrane protein YgaE (UPF0421/DUF939 family)
MLGASLALGLIVRFGFTPLTLTAVLMTGVVTGISMLLFQVWKLDQPPDGGSRETPR